MVFCVVRKIMSNVKLNNIKLYNFILIYQISKFVRFLNKLIRLGTYYYYFWVERIYNMFSFIGLANVSP